MVEFEEAHEPTLPHLLKKMEREVEQVKLASEMKDQELRLQNLKEEARWNYKQPRTSDNSTPIDIIDDHDS